ncbi:endonuclease domain-containing protein [Naasia lichenicola]|uniref:DUF559 domain-containing protein n=1 Tax=Naasia lichenicola TaxID=2565933 RepID=A0A4V3WTK3_9MICO|nr:DUF559 domain-containing protein [Naasia lichenicola]THG32297.1 DUF559 domain-containing protein [Naasia lichenicola]
MDTPAALCSSLDGVARAAELRMAGFSRRSIAAALTGGDMTRPRIGVYALPSLSRSERHALQHGGRLGCVSVAASYGLWTMPFDGDHLSVPPDFHAFDHAACTGVTVHWSGGQAFGRHRRRLPLGDAIRDIGRCQGPEGALVVIESAMHPSRRMVGEYELNLLRELWPEGRDVLDFVDTKADSGLESLMRWRLHRMGIPARSQHRIEGVGRVDLLVGDRLVIELDGATHGDPAGVSNDRRRDAVSTAAGYRTERYGYQQVLFGWPQIEAAILAIIEQGDHLHSGPGSRRRGTRKRTWG